MNIIYKFLFILLFISNGIFASENQYCVGLFEQSLSKEDIKTLNSIADELTHTQHNFNHQGGFKITSRETFDASSGMTYPQGSYFFTRGHYPANKIKVADINDKLKGEIPFWKIEYSNELASSIIESNKGSFTNPFVKEIEGKKFIFIYAHYADTEGIGNLVREFGAVSGSIPSEMTLSPRTLLIRPRSEAPFYLKFTGKWFNEAKTLTKEDVQLSVIRSAQEHNNPYLIPEPTGFSLKNHNVIFRPFYHQVLKRSLKSDEHIFGLHALLSRDFIQTKLGKTIESNFGQYYKWFEKEFAPHFAKYIVDSFFQRGMHYELHTQNIEVLLSNDGKIKKILVKDLLDSVEDPLLKKALNIPFDIKNNPANKLYMNQEYRFASLDDPTRSRREITSWYRSWLGKFQNDDIYDNLVARIGPADMALKEYPEDTVQFYEKLGSHIVKYFFTNKNIKTLFNKSEVAEIKEKIGFSFSSSNIGDFTDGLDIIRDAVIFKKLEENFEIVSTSEAYIIEKLIVSKSNELIYNQGYWRTTPFNPTFRPKDFSIKYKEKLNLKFGTFQGYPTAVNFNSEGAMISYFFLLQ